MHLCSYREICHAAVSCSYWDWGKGGATPRCLQLAKLMERCECGWGGTKVEDGTRRRDGVRRPGLGWRKKGQGFWWEWGLGSCAKVSFFSQMMHWNWGLLFGIKWWRVSIGELKALVWRLLIAGSWVGHNMQFSEVTNMQLNHSLLTSHVNKQIRTTQI